MSKPFECVFSDNCQTRRIDIKKCETCGNNTRRNYVEDHYKPAEDKPIPDQCPRLYYTGPAEQTMGYQCPVCKGYTNPYEMRGSLCKHCGYKLNTGN